MEQEIEFLEQQGHQFDKDKYLLFMEEFFSSEYKLKDICDLLRKYADQKTEQLKKDVESLKGKLDNEQNKNLDLGTELLNLQSQLSEKDKEYKEHVEKLCRNIRILEERIKDGDKELSELKEKRKEERECLVKINDYFFCEKPLDEGEYYDLIKLTEKVIKDGQ